MPVDRVPDLLLLIREMLLDFSGRRDPQLNLILVGCGLHYNLLHVIIDGSPFLGRMGE